MTPLFEQQKKRSAASTPIIMPVFNSAKVIYENLPQAESFAFTDIHAGKMKFRIYTTHLISMSLRKQIIDERYPLSPRYDSLFSFDGNPYQKLIYYDSLHVRQARQLNDSISKSPYPVILTGDMNATPASYVYYLARGNKRDVFLEKGTGFGTTYSFYSPTLRIDYIFADRSFKVCQTDIPALYLSDHFPVVTDIKMD